MSENKPLSVDFDASATQVIKRAVRAGAGGNVVASTANEIQEYGAGEVIFVEGGQSESAYIVREGAVLGMGVYIGQSTKIVDRETGTVTYGEVPAGSVVVAGSMPSKNGTNLYCVVIVKKVDAKTRSKTSINELLRD